MAQTPTSLDDERSLEDIPYPREWEADVVLRDGSVARVRPITPQDAAALNRFHDALSDESIYLRFFAPMRHLSERDVHRFTHVDHDERVALVALVGGDIIGVGRYDRLDDRSVAEVAFSIADHYHGRGVGSVLLEHLAAIGKDAGVSRFIADVLPQNRKMMKVFTDAGYEVKHRFDDGVIAVSFRIEPSDKSLAVQLAREHRAEAQSMQKLFTPRSIAVVGVSRRADAIGSVALDNLMDAGFVGSLHVVNKEADTVRGLVAHRRVVDIEQDIDLAVIAVPAEAVLGVVDDCAEAGVSTLLVLSTGFAEAGPEGEARQSELLARARTHGMRVVGPNAFGIVNTHPDVRLDATIARALPPAGTLGLFAQSGGLGQGLLAAASRRAIGISTFASAGNRVDVSGNDVMQFWIDDDATAAVGLYLESVGNARKFSRIARQLSLRKPVVAVASPTAGQVPPGHRVRSSRVGRAGFDAMLEQAGVISATTIREMLDICELLVHQPLPEGDRIAAVGNSPGYNAIITQAARDAGLQVPAGPVTLPLATAATETARAVDAALADPDVDSVVVCLVPPLSSSEEEIASAVAHCAWGADKPVVAAFVGTRDVTPVMLKAGKTVDPDRCVRRVVPVHSSPLVSIATLAAATRYAMWRRRDHGERLYPADLDRGTAARLVRGVLEATPEGRELDATEVSTLLSAFGIQVWPSVAVSTADEAVAAGESLGYPTVLKSVSESVRSRPGLGSVRAEIGSEPAMRDAFEGLTERLRDLADPELVVQRMAPSGVPTVLTTTEDALFGPVVSFGIAGPPTELLDDVSHRIPPLTDVDAAALVDSLGASPLLLGYRGSVPVDRAALENVILRVSALAEEVPEIAHLRLDVLNVHPAGAEVLGAHVHVGPATMRTDAGRRALR